MMIKIMEKDYS